MQYAPEPVKCLILNLTVKSFAKKDKGMVNEKSFSDYCCMLEFLFKENVSLD